MENQPKKKKVGLWIILALAGILVLFFTGKAIYHAIIYESTDNAQVESNATPVLSRIAGYIDSLNVRDYQNVQSGQLLVTIDDREARIALQQAEADLMNAQADLSSAQSLVENSRISRKVAEANREVQQVRLDKAKKDFHRDEALFKDGSITARQYEDSKSNLETATKQYQAANEQVSLAGSQIGSAEAQVQKSLALIKVREAAVANARLKLSYSTITSPAHGRIGKVNLEPGQYIQPGQPLFTIVDNEAFWIIANFKETQIRQLRIGQVVNIKLDGYPGRELKGRISSFSDATGAKFALLPPDNATGNFVKITQRVPVKIDIENEADLHNILKAGLSAQVDVHVK